MLDRNDVVHFVRVQAAEGTVALSVNRLEPAIRIDKWREAGPRWQIGERYLLGQVVTVTASLGRSRL